MYVQSYLLMVPSFDTAFTGAGNAFANLSRTVKREHLVSRERDELTSLRVESNCNIVMFPWIVRHI